MILLTLLFLLCLASQIFASLPAALDVPNSSFYLYQMMNDITRNQAFCSTIQKNVHNGTTVLEVGGGAGLLTICAAVKGGVVTVVEYNEQVYELLQTGLQVNGLVEKVRSLFLHSDRLRLNEHFSGHPVDVFVSETFDNVLLGENFVVSLQKLRSEGIVSPKTIIIPSRGKVILSLAQSIRSRFFNTFGLDFEFLDDRMPKLKGHSAEPRDFKRLSDPVVGFDLNFQDMDPMNGNWLKQVDFSVQQYGKAHGILFWWELDVDHEGLAPLSNSPYREDSHWGLLFTPFHKQDEFIAIPDGDIVSILVATDSSEFFVKPLPKNEQDWNGAPYFIFLSSSCSNKTYQVFRKISEKEEEEFIGELISVKPLIVKDNQVGDIIEVRNEFQEILSTFEIQEQRMNDGVRFTFDNCN